VYRRAVVSFALITFICPMALGSAIGFSLNWDPPAAFLLGALFASHTLLLYPTVRQAGLTTHPAVATAVGATVITDTLSLIVLAAVSGSQLVGGSTAAIALQVAVGLAVLLIFSLVVLPRIARMAFRRLGTDRVVRYLLAIASFLGAATLADSFGIEGIVGAFFAGLGLNRLVPNEGPLMDRIDFFGAAVFVPIFLVSVGMLLDPQVMIKAETLKFAGLFIAASIGGKAIAAGAARLTLGYSPPEAALMLGLTIPQAAATLAATVVGFNIGLFGQSVVNAVLVLILASIIVGTVIVEQSKKKVLAPSAARDPIGKRVLVALEDARQAPLGFEIAARVAAPDSGIVRGLLRSSPSDAPNRERELAQLRKAGFALGVDTDPALLVHGSLEEGVINTVAVHHPSLVLITQQSASAAPALGTAGEAVAATIPSPVAIVIGDVQAIASVQLVETHSDGHHTDQESIGLAEELATRIGGKKLIRSRSSQLPSAEELQAGQVCIAAVTSWEMLAASDPPEGAALMFVLEPALSASAAGAADAELRLS
jgi:Kef-type K+ transport system membrane component KefB